MNHEKLLKTAQAELAEAERKAAQAEQSAAGAEAAAVAMQERHSATDEQISALEQSRKGLASKAIDGDKQARARLDEIFAKRKELATDLEVLSVAVQEASELATAAREACKVPGKAAAHAQAKLAALRICSKAGAVDAAMRSLEEALLARQQEIDALDALAGNKSGRDDAAVQKVREAVHRSRTLNVLVNAANQYPLLRLSLNLAQASPQAQRSVAEHDREITGYWR